jgi:hypothetical protein
MYVICNDGAWVQEEQDNPMERLRRAEAAAAEYIVAMEAQRFAADYQHAPPLPLALLHPQSQLQRVDRGHEHITAALLVASARAADVVAPSAHPPTAAEAEAAEVAAARMSGLTRFRIALDDARTELLSREGRESDAAGAGPLALPAAAAAADATPPTSVALHPSAASAMAALSLGVGGGAIRTTNVSVRRRRGTALGSLRARLNLGDSP